jgi:hypothetical protein
VDSSTFQEQNYLRKRYSLRLGVTKPLTETLGQKDPPTDITEGASHVGMEVVAAVTTYSQFILNQFTLKRSTLNLLNMCSQFITNQFIHIRTMVQAVPPVEARSHTVRVQLPVRATAMAMGEHINFME